MAKISSKAFYKKALAITTIALSLVTIVGCSNNSNNDNNKVESTQKTKQKSKKIKKIHKNSNHKEINLRKKYAEIEVGSPAKSANDGSSTEEVIKLLGKPDSSTTIKTHDSKAKNYSWNEKKTNLKVGFKNNKVVSKKISNFKWNRKNKNINMKAYKEIKNGSAYSDLIGLYGEPDDFHQTSVSGKKAITATYLTNIDGTAGAKAEFYFINDKLTNKKQIGLK